MHQLVKQIEYDLKQITKRIHTRLPEKLQYPKAFWDTYHFLKISQTWDENQLREYQLKNLKALLNEAYSNVPYYQNVFKTLGLHPEDIEKFEGYKQLPFLSKEMVRSAKKEIINRRYKKFQRSYNTTGGSTGEPLGFYEDRFITEAREYAFTVMLWERVGFKLGDKRLILRGGNILDPRQKNFWEYNPKHSTLFLTSHFMNETNMDSYIQKIRDFKPDFFHVYPSNLTILAKYMKGKNIEPFQSIRGVLCASEKLYPWQRKLFEDVFKCKVHSFYGHTEKAVMAGECECSHNQHIFPEYGYTELIDNHGNTITTEGEIGEIVATGFNNKVTPFIRYRTGDLASYTFERCQCGRHYPMFKEIEGRSQEFLITKSGSIVSLNPALYSIHDHKWTELKAIQFIQQQNGKLEVLVVKGDKSLEDDVSKHLTNLLRSRFQDQFHYTFIFVDEIPKTKRGKHKYLIQKLPIEWKH